MKPLLPSLHFALALGLLAGGWQPASAAIRVINAKGGDLIPFSICPAKDGANVLNPNPPTYLPPPGLLSPIRLELMFGDTAFPGWTFRKGAALNGTLTIKKYKSRFLGEHYSGAEIEAQYVPAATDPANLHYVQLVTTSDPMTGATSPYIDPYPNDTNDMNRPFYWTLMEELTHGQNLRFYDFSKREHPPTSFVTWRGDLHLSSWDGNSPGTVTLHDGIRWGFDAGCVEGLCVLRIWVLTETVVLVWNDTALPHRAEWTETLGTNASWHPLDGTVTKTNGQNRMEVPRDKAQCYYRIALVTPEPEPPSIVTQPASQTNTYGATVTLEVEATGAADLAYQWMHNGTALSGETNSVLTISNAQPSHAGQYHAVVSNQAGAVTTEPAMVMLRNCALTISGQPRNTTNAAGTTATFAVNAGGFPAPSTFQWQRRSGTVAFANIPGATSQTYARHVTMADNGSQFRCIVGNGCATVPSAPATLTVNGGQTNGLTIQSVTVPCNETLLSVTFNQPVDPSSAMNLNAYQLTPVSGPPLELLDVQMQSPNTVWLVLDQPILPGMQYTLTAYGVRDLSGNPPPPDSARTFNCQ